MPKTYERIASTVLTSGTASVTFSSIPQTYTDIVLVSQYSVGTNNDGGRIQFNSDTGSNYSRTHLRSNGSSTGSSTATNQTYIYMDLEGAGNTIQNPTQSIVEINNYSNTTTYKTALIRSGNIAGSYTGTSLICGLWRSNSAISTITLTTDSSTFITGSSFILYGIKAA